MQLASNAVTYMAVLLCCWQNDNILLQYLQAAFDEDAFTVYLCMRCLTVLES